MSLIQFIVSDIIPYYEPETFIVSPDNVESFIKNPTSEVFNKLVVTGFNRDPYWYVRLYDIYRQYHQQYHRWFIIVNPVYIPLELDDDYDVIISIYGYYRVHVIYDPDKIDRVINRYRRDNDRLLVISNILPESDIVVHPLNQQRYHHNVDIIIDNTRDPKSIMEERIYLFEPSFNKTYTIIRNISYDEYQQLPIFPELDMVQSHIGWIESLLNPNPFQQSSYMVKNGYERYYIELEHYNRFHLRFIGKDDLETLINIWNTMVDEVGIDNVQMIHQWSHNNYIDSSWLVRLATISDRPNGKVQYNDIVLNINNDRQGHPTYHRVSVGIYRNRYGEWYYRSNLIPFSHIDIDVVYIIKLITTKLAIRV
jgi:hypothetical protein